MGRLPRLLGLNYFKGQIMASALALLSLPLYADSTLDHVLDRLFIGGASDLKIPLRELGFRAVLDLRDSGTDVDVVQEVKRITNRDGDPWTPAQVHEALDFVAEQIRYGRVLIACAAGMSRSASMVVGFLVRSGWDAPTALEHLRRCRPIIAPVPAMLASVLSVVEPNTGGNVDKSEKSEKADDKKILTVEFYLLGPDGEKKLTCVGRSIGSERRRYYLVEPKTAEAS